MESPARELDEARTDTAIAGILSEADAGPEAAAAEMHRPEFPALTPQDTSDEDDTPQDTGVAAILRQTWAHLSGAA